MRATAEPGEEGGVLSWLQETKQYDVKKKPYEVVLIHDKKASLESRYFNYAKAKELTKQGYLIVASGRVNWLKGIGPDADHIFGISDVDLDDETFKVFDPWSGKEEWHDTKEHSEFEDIDGRRDDMNVFYYSYAIKPKI